MEIIEDIFKQALMQKSTEIYLPPYITPPISPPLPLLYLKLENPQKAKIEKN